MRATREPRVPARARTRAKVVAAVLVVLGLVSVFGGGAAAALWSVSDGRMATTATAARLAALPAPVKAGQAGGSLTVDVGAGRSSDTLAPVYTLERSTTASFTSPVRVGQGSSQTFVDGGHLAPVATSTRFSEIVMAIHAGCGLTGGRVMCWGRNNSYQLGRGDRVDSPNVPVPVKTTADDPASQLPANETILDIAAGTQSFCATSATAVYCWGGNDGGLVDPTTAQPTLPVKVLERHATVITVGRTHACALLSPGGPYCWGSNEFGQLGANLALTTTPQLPVKVLTGGVGGSQVPGGTTPTVIAAGADFSCMVASGKAYCWGSGAGGNLGNGKTTNHSVPQSVVLGGSSAIPTTATFTAIDTSASVSAIVGQRATCALASGVAYCWGNNGSGALGNGQPTTFVTAYATKVTGLPAGTVTHLASGFAGSCAIIAGASYCWGSNVGGQLTDGTTQFAITAVKSTLPAGKTAVSTNGSGEARCWGFSDGTWGCAGSGTYGQLGEGPTGRLTSPTTTIGTVVTPSPLLCAAGATWLPDGTCTLATGTTYYYRSTYTLGAWTSPVTGPVGLRVS